MDSGLLVTPFGRFWLFAKPMKSFNLSQQPTMCPTIHTFIGFQKASDYIHRGMMIKIHGVNGVPPYLLKAIQLMYQNIFAEVLTPTDDKTA